MTLRAATVADDLQHVLLVVARAPLDQAAGGQPLSIMIVSLPAPPSSVAVLGELGGVDHDVALKPGRAGDAAVDNADRARPGPELAAGRIDGDVSLPPIVCTPRC